MEYWQEEEIKRPIINKFHQRYLEICEMSDREAWNKAMAAADFSDNPDGALVYMIGQIIEYRYGGLDLFSPSAHSESFQVKFGSSQAFKCNTWMAGVAKAYLALLNRKAEDKEIEQALKEVEGK